MGHRILTSVLGVNKDIASIYMMCIECKSEEVW